MRRAMSSEAQGQEAAVKEASWECKGDPKPPPRHGLCPLQLAGHLRPPWGHFRRLCDCPPPLAWAELPQTAGRSPGVVTWRPVSVGRLCVQRPGLPEAEQGLLTSPHGLGCWSGARPAGTAPAPMPLVHIPSDRRQGLGTLGWADRWGPGFQTWVGGDFSGICHGGAVGRMWASALGRRGCSDGKAECLAPQT